MKKFFLVILLAVAGLVWVSDASACNFKCVEKTTLAGTNNVPILVVTSDCGPDMAPDSQGWSGKWGGYGDTGQWVLKLTRYKGVGMPPAESGVWDHLKKIASQMPARAPRDKADSEDWEFFSK